MIIIHAADIHLGSPLGGLDRHEGLPIERIRSAPLAAFARIADLCEARGASLLLIAGDLFDGDSGMAVIREAERVMRRIAAGGTTVVTIRGNHDAASRMQRRLARIDGVHELSALEPETLELELGGERVAVHGRGFDSQHVSDNIVASYPPAVASRLNVGLLHTSLEGRAAHAVYAPCELADLVAKGYDYWALGHIHQHEVLREDPWIVHAGSPQGRHIGETGEHGVYVIEVDGGKVVGRPEHVELGVVQWHRLEVDAGAEPGLSSESGAEELRAVVGEKVAALVAGAGDEVVHVVRLVLTGRCAADAELRAEPGRWRDELATEASAAGGAGCYLEQVRFSTEPVLPPLDSLHLRDDFVGRLAVHLDATAMEVGAGAAPPASPPAALAKLDDKLRPLGAHADALRGQAVSAEERAAAGEQLLSRLLVASAGDAEAGR